MYIPTTTMSQEMGKTCPAADHTGRDATPQTEVNIEEIQELPITTVIQEKGDKDLTYYLPLYKAIIRGNWKSAKEYFDEHTDAVTARITEDSDTALHIAIAKRKGTYFVKKLVELMATKEAPVSLKNINGDTALHVAAAVGDTEAAKLLVKQNPELPLVRNNIDGWLPLHVAARFGHGEMFHYLLGVTNDQEISRLEDQSRFQLPRLLFSAGLYREVLDLILKYPELATMKFQDQTLLEEIAANPSVFFWNVQGVWEAILLLCVPAPTGRVEENPTDRIPRIKHVRKLKLQHYQIRQIAKHLCEKAAELDYLRASAILKPPLLLAARLGIHEVVKYITQSFPYAIHFRDEKNRNIFQLAVLNRHLTVMITIHRLSSYIPMRSSRDNCGNNILHLAGLLAPQHRFVHLPNLVLWMQSEIQWFEGVEKFVPPAYKLDMNSEGKTPVMVFKEEHLELIKEAEIWLRDTATSGSVVAALVATIAFAAAITVPGGNSSDNAHPIFSKEKAFTIFAISNAFSLFASTASLLLFLSILTSRYAHSDFRHSLPNRLLWNLHLLFLSILFMVIAFCATLHLVFGNGKSQILILVAICASLPVILFMFLQYPLLTDLLVFLHGHYMLGIRSNHILY